MITLNNLGMSFGPQVLFEKVSLQFTAGNRYGIVGPNGAGKSTLLKIICGTEQASDGDVSMPRGCRVGFLKQDHFKYEQFTCMQTVLQGREELWDILQEKDALLEQQNPDNDRLAAIEDRLAALGAYDVETEVTKLLTGLGLASEKINGPLSALSGGYKLRVLLAQVLFSEPEVLVLDEPTNHLDILSIRWLEEYLNNEYGGMVLTVSHDRTFLDNICTHIADIDFQTITLYKGDYESFIKARDLAVAQQQKLIDQQEKKIAEMQQFVDRFKAKATKARQAQSRVKQIEKLEEDIPDVARSNRQSPRLAFEQKRPSGKVVLKAEDLARSFGDLRVFQNVTFEVNRGDRVAILGPNGVGKSTLINLITDQLEPDNGKYEWGFETYFGAFSQDHHELNGQKQSIFDWLYHFWPEATIGQIYAVLACVLFTQEEVKKSCKNLSGGEKARLLLARLMVQKPNVLILDEPTNHLDLEAVEALENSLKEFEGTVIMVSHDRHFVQNVATRIFEITANGLVDYHGDYGEFVARHSVDYFNANTMRARKDSPKKKVSQNERRDVRKKARALEKKVGELEKAVGELEKRQKEIEQKFSDPAFYDNVDQDELIELDTEKSDNQKKLQVLEAEWEEQSALYEQIKAELEN